jgi:hypothetical protein
MTQAELLAQIAKLQAENAALKAKPARSLSLKVTEKGGISLYGMGRFPVTLYRSQWEQVIAHGEQIKAFIEANAASLSTKD